jgi:hypothetical protein
LGTGPPDVGPEFVVDAASLRRERPAGAGAATEKNGPTRPPVQDEIGAGRGVDLRLDPDCVRSAQKDPVGDGQRKTKEEAAAAPRKAGAYEPAPAEKPDAQLQQKRQGALTKKRVGPCHPRQ